MAFPIQLELFAEVKSAVNGLNEVKQDTRELGEQFSFTNEEMMIFGGNFKKLDADIANVNKTLQDFVNGNLPKITPAIQNTEVAAKKLSLTLAQQRIAFMDLGRVVTEQGFSLRAMASNFSLLGPEIVIAAAAVAFIGKEWYEYATKVSKAEEAQRNLKKVLDDSEAKVAGELANLRSLIGIMNDATASTTAHANAKAELIHMYPDIMKMYTDEKTHLVNTTKLYEDLSKAILMKARVDGLQQAIAAETKKQYDNQNKSTKETLTTWDDFVSIINTLGSASARGSHTIKEMQEAMAAKKKKDLWTESAANIEDMEKKFDKANAEFMKSPLAKYLLGIIDPPKHNPKIDEARQLVDILNEVKSVTEATAKLENRPIRTKEEQSGHWKDTLGGDDGKTIIATQFDESAEVKDLNAKLQKVASDAKKDPKNKAAYAELAAALTKEIEVLKNPDLHVRVGQMQNPEEGMDILDKHLKTLPKTLKETVEVHLTPKIVVSNAEIAKAQAEIDKINKQIESTVQQGMETLANGLGDIISGDGLNKSVNKMGHVIGEGLKAIGKILIESGTTMEAIKNASRWLSAHPVVAVAAGIAAEIAGQIIENKAQQAIKAVPFATGGIITGPTLGLIGEAGPEVVFPLDKLKSFMGGMQPQSAGGFVASTRLSGNDMLILLNRAQKNSNLRS